jgi:uncharacterized membrane protein
MWITRLALRLFLATLFIGAGVFHLVEPAFFLPIMPPWIPWPISCIVVSGGFELMGGVGLLVPNRRVQRFTGIGLTLLLLAVFPANIYMAVGHIQVHGSQPWMAWARLPLQPLLIAGVLWVTDLFEKTH